MATTMTHSLIDTILPADELFPNNYTGTCVPELGHILEQTLPYREANYSPPPRTSENISWVSPEIISAPFVDSEYLSYVIHDFLDLSNNKLRDGQIADRINTLYWDAFTEDERILSPSLRQFMTFFLTHPDLSRPRITLTPDNTLRVRWIQGTGDFTAIEFIGGLIVKLVAEIPRKGGVTAKYFVSEHINNIRSFINEIGASL